MEATTTLAVLLVAAAGTAVWLWALADTLRRPAESFATGGRTLWAVVIALTHLAGALLYLLVGRDRAPNGTRS